MFTFGPKSEKELVGVYPGLVRVARRALELSPVDFAVHDGIRTIEEQKHYVSIGTSKTMKSKHLIGQAVDLVPYFGGKLQWNWQAIYKIAAAVKQASDETGAHIRWGCVWDREMSELAKGVDDPEKLPEALKNEGLKYNVRHAGIDFPDGPHFEILI